MRNTAATAALRERLRPLRADGLPRCAALPFGVPALDERLADGGLRLDALHEAVPATASLADERRATLFLAGVGARLWGPVLWVARGGDLFAPDPSLAGLSPDRLIRVEGGGDAEVLALMEVGLLHRGLGAVVGEVRRMGAAAARRLRLAAEGGRTPALLLRRGRTEAADPPAASSAAATRWRVGVAPARRGAPAGERERWALRLDQQQGGEPFAAPVAACDGTGRLAPAHGPARPPVIRSAATDEDARDAA